ncbi:MAG: phosphatidylcholine/phosphatidylserine synthase [Crocinitomicaceae bacterium]
MAKKRRSVPNFFTILNLVGGLLAIQFSLTGHLDWAPYCIFAAIIFDFFDGFMAGILKVKSDKGKQMDSLADIITFGAAPGFIVFALFKFVKENYSVGYDDQYAWMNYLEYFAFIIPIFALFRLAKFNVDTKQSTSFIGVPTATMAIFFASFPILIDDAVFEPRKLSTSILDNILLNPYALMVLTVLFSIMMVAKIPLFALKFKQFKWQGNEIQIIFLILCLLCIMVFKFWAVPIIVLLYILMSIVNNWRIKLKNKK